MTSERAWRNAWTTATIFDNLYNCEPIRHGNMHLFCLCGIKNRYEFGTGKPSFGNDITKFILRDRFPLMKHSNMACFVPWTKWLEGRITQTEFAKTIDRSV